MDKLQRKLLFTINAANAKYYGLSVLQTGVEFDRVQGTTLLLTKSQDIEILWRCTIDAFKPNQLDAALQTIGHIKLFIFAYALVSSSNLLIL
jgi:hypothetical protein